MHSRRTKSILPISNRQLFPQTVNHQKVTLAAKQTQDRQKQCYDKSAKQLKPLKIHDPVRVRMGKTWIPGKVIQQNDSRSYTVQTRDGKLFRRNRRVLNKTNESVLDISPFDCNIFNNTPTEPQLQLANSDRNVNTPSQIAETPYMTRSGRVVRKNPHYYSNEWETR